MLHTLIQEVPMPSCIVVPRTVCALLFAALLIPHALLAWQPGDPWVIAGLTTNPAVRPALAGAESAVLSGSYVHAAELLGSLLDSPDGGVCAELDCARDPQPPLRLLARAARVQYLQFHDNWQVSDALGAEAEAAVMAFAPAARGKQWHPYNVLLDVTLSYYTRRGDTNGVARLYDLAFESGRLQTYLLTRYAAWAAKQGMPAAVIRERIASNIVDAASLSSSEALTLLPIINEGNAAIIAAALAWLDRYPGAPIAELRTAIGLINTRLDPANHEQVRAYHAALCALAFRQPADDEARIDVIACAVNERRKLEILMPSLAQ